MAMLNNQRVMSMAGMIGYEVYPCHTIGPRPFMHTAWRARVWCTHLICSKLRCLPVVLFRKFSTALVLLCLVSSLIQVFVVYHFAERQLHQLPFLTHLFNIRIPLGFHFSPDKHLQLTAMRFSPRADQVPQLQHHPRRCRERVG